MRVRRLRQAAAAAYRSLVGGWPDRSATADGCSGGIYTNMRRCYGMQAEDSCKTNVQRCLICQSVACKPLTTSVTRMSERRSAIGCACWLVVSGAPGRDMFIHKRLNAVLTLPESQALPSAKNFIEFFLSRALNKGCLCRVPKLEHSTKPRHSAKIALGKDALFAECSDIPLGKDFLCRVSTSHTRQILARR